MTLWLLLLACDDTLFLPAEVSTTPTADGPSWCAVEQVLGNQCAVCHSAAGASGGLDLETDPYGAIVDVASSSGGTLVVPGDAQESVLYQRMAGLSGSIMPPGGALDASVVELVATWIDAGATTECGTGTDTGTGTGYHPPGWEDPTVHGMAAKFQTETDCRACHGTELEGGTGPACESCHGPGWETNCTWCHGGVDDGSGAPPEGIDDSTGPQLDTFVPHGPHLQSDIAVLDCDTCHEVPTSALTPGHLFDDDTPGVAEVDFGTPAIGGSWTGGTCTVYCHGTGRADGSLSHDDDPRDCGSCHAGPDNRGRWDEMSGEHEKHLDEDIACVECHPGTVNGADAIVDPTVHVDGSVQVDPPVTWNGATCTGSCHGEFHNGRSW